MPIANYFSICFVISFFIVQFIWKNQPVVVSVVVGTEVVVSGTEVVVSGLVGLVGSTPEPSPDPPSSCASVEV